MAEQTAIPTRADARAATTDRQWTSAGIGDAVVWALLDAAPDGMVVIDEQGRMRLVNRRMEELFGYPRGDLFGEPVERLLPEHSRLGRRRDGSDFPVDISLSPLTTESRQWVIATVRDDTDRRCAEEQRTAAALSEEDFRIASDLGDTVVRGLFGVGLRLQGLQSRAGTAVQAEIGEVIADIDRTIRDIRGVIFGMRPTGRAAPLP